MGRDFQAHRMSPPFPFSLLMSSHVTRFFNGELASYLRGVGNVFLKIPLYHELG